MARILNFPEGEGITYDPRQESGWESFGRTLSVLANQARQSQQIQQDRAILRRILGQDAESIMGTQPQAPTSLSGRVMQGMGRMFGVGRENMPISDIQKAVIEAKLKQMGQEWKPQTREQALEYERAKRPTFSFSTEGTNKIEIPEGFEIVGYDQKANPMIRKIKPSPVDIASDKQKRQAASDFLIAKNKLSTTLGAFKAMTEAAGGSGRIKGFIGSELAGKVGINPYTQAYKGQLNEAAAALAKLASPSARVGQEIIAMFKQTLPAVISTEPEALNQIRFSLHNAFATVLGKEGKSYTPEIRKMIDDMFEEISKEPALTLKENINFQEGQTATNPKTGQKIIFRGGKWQE